MKKTLKSIVALAASTLLMAGPVATSTLAQTTFDEAFFTELSEANKHFESMKFDGLVKVSAVSDDQVADMGQMTFKGSFNGIPLQGSFEGEVSSLFLGGKKMPVQAFYQNSIAYLGFPGGEEGKTEWQAMDFSKQESEIIKGYQDAYKEASASQDPKVVADLNNKYMNVEETDTEYVFTLKEDINADELWADVNSLVDLNAAKEQMIKQTEEQTGEKIDDETRAQIDKAYSVESLQQFLNMKPVVKVSYDKATKQLTKFLLDLNVNVADFTSEEQAASAEESGMPQNFLVHIEANVTDHNVPQEVVVPEEALSVEVSQPTELEEISNEIATPEETSEVEGETTVAEETVAEETAATEETTVEETTAQ